VLQSSLKAQNVSKMPKKSRQIFEYILWKNAQFAILLKLNLPTKFKETRFCISNFSWGFQRSKIAANNKFGLFSIFSQNWQCFLMGVLNLPTLLYEQQS
jgi:hypothetical protein